MLPGFVFCFCHFVFGAGAGAEEGLGLGGGWGAGAGLGGGLGERLWRPLSRAEAWGGWQAGLLPQGGGWVFCFTLRRMKGYCTSFSY